MKYFRIWIGRLLLATITLLGFSSHAADKLPQALEIVGKVGENLNSKELVAICNKEHIPASDLYQWNNHLVIYGKLPHTAELKKQLAVKYRGCEIKQYETPFYNFT